MAEEAADPVEEGGTAPAALRMEVSAEEPFGEVVGEVSAAVLAHPAVQQDFPSADLWMESFDVLDKDVAGDSRFSAVIRDLTSGRTVTASGYLDSPHDVFLDYASSQRPPTDDEFTWAVDMLVRGDRVTGPYKAENEQPYRPVPALLNVDNPDGSVDRVIAVGLRTPEGAHRVVGVRTADGTTILDPTGVPAPSTGDCGAPLAAACAPAGGARQARVRVWQGEELLWDLVVVRPSASSGVNGSGVEVRTVDYRGKRVLFRGHVPIVTGEYESDGAAAGCGPVHRDWLHEEACFSATGTDPVEGFRVCSEPPETIVESGVDGGDFRGVALWLDGTDLRIVSQLQAGWYRYVSHWTLGADGTIRPRFGFAAVSNPCTCRPHVHHAYWRLDFDITTPGENVVQEFNDPPVFGTSSWHTMRYEARRPRDRSHQRYWRVRHDRSSATYQVMAGPNDGTASDFGAGDVWILRCDPAEIDDGQGTTADLLRARPGLDRFVTGEPVHRQDVVIWYGAHVGHHQASGEGDGGAVSQLVGPDLVPRHWTLEPATSTPPATGTGTGTGTDAGTDAGTDVPPDPPD